MEYAYLWAVLLPFIFLFFGYLYKKEQYEKTDYFKQTHAEYGSLSKNAGRSGEFKTWNILQDVPGYKRFILNCYIPKSDGRTTEVDVIMIHETGIHVFESKNYSGWIFGNETQPYWTQSLATGNWESEKHKFFNPIIQNRVHIKWLSKYLNVDPSLFYSYIVFSDRCSLKSISLSSLNHFVVKWNDLLDTAWNVASHQNAKLTNEQVDEYYNILYARTQIGDSEKDSHIVNIRRRQEGFVFSIICPWCKGKLVVRQAKRGNNVGSSFYGCSNYPRCKYTRNIQQ